jgi:uncharacterized membrane protein YkoI
MRAARALLFLIATLSAMSSMSTAQDLIDRRARKEAQAGISLDQAVQMAQSRYGAKAVKAQTVDRGGRRVHQIRLLSPEGKVWEVKMDAVTGSIVTD